MNLSKKPKLIKADFAKDPEDIAFDLINKSMAYSGPVAVHCPSAKHLKRLAVGVAETFEDVFDDDDSLKIVFEKNGAKVIGFTATEIDAPGDHTDGEPGFQIQAKVVA